jgi:DNA repair photolyase
MKKSKEDLMNEINSSTEEELKKMAYGFLRIKEHIWREFANADDTSESRRRERSRLKIAQKHITNWYNEF